MPHLRTPHPARHPAPTLKARSLAYLIFERPDLITAECFLTDFGLRVASIGTDALFMRGPDSAPLCYLVRRAPKARFVGLALEVASRSDLDRAAAIPGAGPVEALRTPGG